MRRMKVSSGVAWRRSSGPSRSERPCATCHIGAFGPQLTPQGRDFKLHGYVGSDGQNHGLPIAFTTQTSFTHTQAAIPGGAASGFKPNDNVAFDQAAVYLAGRILPEVGAFARFRYNAVRQQPQLGYVDAIDKSGPDASGYSAVLFQGGTQTPLTASSQITVDASGDASISLNNLADGK